MQADLERLLDLQAKDLALLEADTTVAELLAAEEALDERLRRAARDAETAARQLADGAARRDEVGRRVETFRGQQEKRQQRLDGIRNQREANAVMAELDLGRQVLQREEQEWLRLEDEVKRLEQRRLEAETAAAAAEAAQEAERAALRERMAEAVTVRNAALGAREESAAQVDRALRTRYDRLRRARDAKLPVAPLTGFACSVCFTSVPVSRRAAIRGGSLVEGCETCGVILYAPEKSDG
jgi:predicted  nucleic acid-binding Zn-ribbon protein